MINSDSDLHVVVCSILLLCPSIQSWENILLVHWY